MRATRHRKLGAPAQSERWDKVMNEDVVYAREFFELSQKLLENGLIKPHPIQLGQGGWEGVLGGIDLLRKGLVSGAKLVYSVE